MCNAKQYIEETTTYSTNINRWKETLSVSQRTIERDLIIEAMTDIAQIQGSEYDAIKLRISLR